MHNNRLPKWGIAFPCPLRKLYPWFSFHRRNIEYFFNILDNFILVFPTISKVMIILSFFCVFPIINLDKSHHTLIIFAFLVVSINKVDIILDSPYSYWIQLSLRNAPCLLPLYLNWVIVFTSLIPLDISNSIKSFLGNRKEKLLVHISIPN